MCSQVAKIRPGMSEEGKGHLQKQGCFWGAFQAYHTYRQISCAQHQVLCILAHVAKMAREVRIQNLVHLKNFLVF